MTGERLLRMLYRGALMVAGPLLQAGLLVHSPLLLETGVLVVMATPFVGVIVVAASLAAAREWTFAGVALVVLGILASSLWAAAHVRPAAPEPAPSTRAR
jgi:hypothetical protein